MEKLRLGEMLVGNGIISNDQLEKALDLQKKNGGMIGMVLVNLNYISKEQLGEYLKVI
jgi:type IV pilus assembly protein PilB